MQALRPELSAGEENFYIRDTSRDCLIMVFPVRRSITRMVHLAPARLTLLLLWAMC